MKEYYKVVCKINGKNERVSCIFPDYSNQVEEIFKVKYKVGKYVKPNVVGTKLFVFDDLNAATVFARNRDSMFSSNHMEVWKCSITNPGKMKPCEYPCHIKSFWENKRKKVRNYTLNERKNVVSVDSVKITSKVYSTKD